MSQAEGTNVRKADWVTCTRYPDAAHGGTVGLVRRVDRDGSWADVRWPGGTGFSGYSKLMPASSLRIETTIPQPGGWTVTDMSRDRELSVNTGASGVAAK